MIDKYWYEFSKLYARLMRLELQIKRSAHEAIFSFYEQESLEKFEAFLQTRGEEGGI